MRRSKLLLSALVLMLAGTAYATPWVTIVNWVFPTIPQVDTTPFWSRNVQVCGEYEVADTTLIVRIRPVHPALDPDWFDPEIGAQNYRIRFNNNAEHRYEFQAPPGFPTVEQPFEASVDLRQFANHSTGKVDFQLQIVADVMHTDGEFEQDVVHSTGFFLPMRKAKKHLNTRLDVAETSDSLAP